MAVAVESSKTAGRRGTYTRAFLGLMLRDLFVLRREIGPFIIRVAMNPLLFLFVFTYVMPHMSGGAALNPTASMAAAGGGSFGTVLLPGLMAGGDYVLRHCGGRVAAGAGVRHHARNRRPGDVPAADRCSRGGEDRLLGIAEHCRGGFGLSARVLRPQHTRWLRMCQAGRFSSRC